MVSGIDPKVDYVFKRLFGDEDNALLLVDLLNAVLRFPAGRMVSGVTLLNPFMARDFAEGKVSVLDIRARDDPGRQFLLEMQRIVRPDFPRRVVYYWAGTHSEQLLRGDDYEQLLPTFGICWLNESMFQDSAWHHTFHVYDDEHQVVLCKDLEIHVLELSKFAVPVEQVQTPLQRWSYFLKHGASLDPDALPATLDVPVIRQAVEVLVKISQSELERQRYLERQRVERDAISLAAAYKRGEERLRAAEEELRAAQEKARLAQEKGIVIGRIQLLQRFLGQPETSSADLGQLPVENLLQREDSLKQQLSSKKQVNGAGPTDRP